MDYLREVETISWPTNSLYLNQNGLKRQVKNINSVPVNIQDQEYVLVKKWSNFHKVYLKKHATFFNKNYLPGIVL